MPTPPYENTLTTNGTHRQLMELGPSISSGTVTSPARIEERDKGYDIKYETAKRVEYQYKRMTSGPKERAIDGDPDEKWISFPVNPLQIETLLTRTFTTDTAFLTLPLIEYDAHLSKLLERTVFVDVFGFERMAQRAGRRIDDFSRLYVSKDGLEAGNPIVFGKLKDRHWTDTSGAYWRIPPAFVRGWSDVMNRLTGCSLGMPIRTSGNEHLTPLFQDYRRHVMYIQRFVTGENTHDFSSESLIEDLFHYRSEYLRDERIERYDQYWKPTLRDELTETLSELAGGEVGDLSGDYDVDLLYELGEEAPSLNLGTS